MLVLASAASAHLIFPVRSKVKPDRADVGKVSKLKDGVALVSISLF